MATFSLELVSPERLLFAGEVEEVIVPGTEGEFTVLRDHAPFMSTLKPGVVSIGEAGGKRTRLFVRGGFADVAPSGLTILAESAVPLENMDLVRLDLELDMAKGEVDAAPDGEARRIAQEKFQQLGELRAAFRT